jgi:hypothetical protein
MENVFYYFSIVFIVIYLFYLFVVVLNKKKRNSIFDTNQSKLITEPSKLDVSKINKFWFAQVISIANSFIVAFTFACSEFFDNYILKLLVCFAILIVLIFVVYRFIGFVYKKKEGR